MARFVLVHGAAHGAWCWHRLAPLLAAAGHRVQAPDLPGAGGDPADPARVTLADYASRVVDLLAVDGPPAILVGHSMGGLSVTLAAEAAPSRIASAVYLSAFMLRDGEQARDITLLRPLALSRRAGSPRRSPANRGGSLRG